MFGEMGKCTRLMTEFRQFAAPVPQCLAQVRSLICMASHFLAVPSQGVPSLDQGPSCGSAATPLFMDHEVSAIPFAANLVTGQIPHFND
jgi:hypothetical protein